MNHSLLRMLFASILGISVVGHAQPVINDEMVHQVLVRTFDAVVHPTQESVLLEKAQVETVLRELNLTQENLEALHEALVLLEKAVSVLPLVYQESVVSADIWKTIFDDFTARIITEKELEFLMQKVLESPEFENIRNFYVLIENISLIISDIEEIAHAAGYFAQGIQAIIDRVAQESSSEQMAQIIDNAVNAAKPNIALLQTIISGLLSGK